MTFDNLYKVVTDYILDCGKKLQAKAGKIDDIGVTKQQLTEEDLAIERSLKNIIEREGHVLYAEEENFDFKEHDNIWVVDPISSTSSFIKGLGHYAIVASHVHKSEVNFAVVYDPSINELFTARKGGGSFLNGKKLWFQTQK